MTIVSRILFSRSFAALPVSVMKCICVENHFIVCTASLEIIIECYPILKLIMTVCTKSSVDKTVTDRLTDREPIKWCLKVTLSGHASQFQSPPRLFLRILTKCLISVEYRLRLGSIFFVPIISIKH